MASGADQARPSLRERKKAATRAAILAQAERLFEERGYDDVTVAEIADAADVSVKTLFVYFRSKEDLAFADTGLLDALVDAVRHRASGTTYAQAVAAVLDAALISSGSAGLEGYHRGVGESPALRSRLLRMWADCEDALAAALADDAGLPAPTPPLRLAATQLIAIARSFTSPEVRALALHHPDAETEVLRAWLAEAVQQIDEGLAHPLAEGR
jgi:AcrR family transcriptional regulator